MKEVELEWDEVNEESGPWQNLRRQRFEAAYAPEDSVYDQLMDETP
jgi:hypothetical protein